MTETITNESDQPPNTEILVNILKPIIKRPWDNFGYTPEATARSIGRGSLIDLAVPHNITPEEARMRWNNALLADRSAQYE